MRISRWVMVALFVVSAVLVVEAQQPRQGGFGQANTTNAVLSNKDLQEELKVTDAQKEKFKGVTEKQTAAFKKNMEAYKEAGGDKEKMKELREGGQKDAEKLNDEIKKVVEETLTSDQKKRLAQIDLQVKGMRAFSDEKIAKDLSIADGQASKIKGVMEEYAKDSKELGFGGGKGDKEKSAENQKKREKLTKAAMADVDEVLTAEQKAKWKEMVGAPFDTAKLRQGGFGGFGGNKNKTKD